MIIAAAVPQNSTTELAVLTMMHALVCNDDMMLFIMLTFGRCWWHDWRSLLFICPAMLHVTHQQVLDTVVLDSAILEDWTCRGICTLSSNNFVIVSSTNPYSQQLTVLR